MQQLLIEPWSLLTKITIMLALSRNHLRSLLLLDAIPVRACRRLMRPRNIIDFSAIYIVCVFISLLLLPFSLAYFF